MTTLRRLLQGPQEINNKYANRHLAAAKLRDDVTLRLRLSAIETEGDGEEWEDYAANLGNGHVVCPLAEILDDDHGDDCEMCGGGGMVSRAAWDRWFYAEKSCKDFRRGCEVGCQRIRCPYDRSRVSTGVAVLTLEASKKGSWVDRGNSLEGFKLAGLCENLPALARYLDLVCEATGVARGEE